MAFLQQKGISFSSFFLVPSLSAICIRHERRFVVNKAEEEKEKKRGLFPGKEKEGGGERARTFFLFLCLSPFFFSTHSVSGLIMT